MNVDDMILVSIDDHVVEPPEMFDAHLPQSGPNMRPASSPTITEWTGGCIAVARSVSPG